MARFDRKITPARLFRSIFNMHRRLFATRIYKELPDIEWWNVLAVLGRSRSLEEPPRQKDLAAELGCSPATITGVLKKMEAADLVVRKYDTADQRANRITISELGMEYMNAFTAIESDIDEHMYRGFSKEEREQLQSYYLRICDNLIEMGAHCPRYLADRYNITEKERVGHEDNVPRFTESLDFRDLKPKPEFGTRH